MERGQGSTPRVWTKRRAGLPRQSEIGRHRRVWLCPARKGRDGVTQNRRALPAAGPGFASLYWLGAAGLGSCCWARAAVCAVGQGWQGREPAPSAPRPRATRAARPSPDIFQDRDLELFIDCNIGEYVYW